jgi:multisubunit Na+/H+ antiporter MnhG subunit
MNLMMLNEQARISLFHILLGVIMLLVGYLGIKNKRFGVLIGSKPGNKITTTSGKPAIILGYLTIFWGLPNFLMHY